MENHRLIEVFGLIKSNLINGNPDNQTGICKSLQNIYNDETVNLTVDEYYFIQKYLEKNQPNTNNQYAEFTKSPYWLDNFPNSINYWWEKIVYVPATKQSRIDYLTMLINNIK